MRVLYNYTMDSSNVLAFVSDKPQATRIITSSLIGASIVVKRLSSGSKFEDEIGYSRAVVKNNIVYLSGTTGYNYETNQISNNILEQTEQCIQNIRQALLTAVVL